jgi:hypothetical protein
VSVGAFDVFKAMAGKNDQALRVVPLSNIVGVTRVKAGCHITIGAPVDVMVPIALGDFVGGLILCDEKRYLEVSAEIEGIAAKITEAVQGGLEKVAIERELLAALKVEHYHPGFAGSIESPCPTCALVARAEARQ